MANPFLDHPSFSLILDALHDGVAVYDRDGTLVWANDKVCQILGFPRAELIGRNVKEIIVLPTFQAFVSADFAERPPTAAWSQGKRIEDFASPGYLAFTNGRQVLYTETSVRDKHGDLLYAVYTLRDVTDLNEARQKITDLQQLTTFYQDQLRTLHTRVLGRDLVYRSETMRTLVERALRLAQLDGNVLLTGETGVGKNMLARYIHVTSQRARGPFIHVNCASLPESLVEAELFGYSEGAFTGAARKGKKGLIELGHGGTVFLDEIGDMLSGMQAKLLTVLEDKAVRRIGGERWMNVDVRFVAATNQNPEALLQRKSLREDLYYRLAEHSIHLPPLRERWEDIPSLVEHALAEFNDKNGTIVTFQSELIQHLQALPLPGNVRELKSLVWRIASEVGKETKAISWHMLPPELTQVLERRNEPSASVLPSPPRPVEGGTAEERQLRELCERCQGDVYAMADALGVHRTTVIRKLRGYGISYARKKSPRMSHGERSAPRVATIIPLRPQKHHS